jgi:hypothetical protein
MHERWRDKGDTLAWKFEIGLGPAWNSRA